MITSVYDDGILASMRTQSNLFHIVANYLYSGKTTCGAYEFESGNSLFVADGKSNTAGLGREKMDSSFVFVFPQHEIKIASIDISRAGTCVYPEKLKIEGLNSYGNWDILSTLEIFLDINEQKSFSINSNKFYQQIRLHQILSKDSYPGLFLREVEFYGSVRPIHKYSAGNKINITQHNILIFLFSLLN